jgi:hypothetical protein
VNDSAPLPRRDAYMPPDWWRPYAVEFSHWRAWYGASLFWARLPGTMRVCHADDPADLASQVRAVDASRPHIWPVRDGSSEPGT